MFFRRAFSVLVVLFFSSLLLSCDLTKILGAEKDDDSEPGTEAWIDSFVFRIEDNPDLDATIEAFVDASQIITARLPSTVVASGAFLSATVELSPGATIDPDPATGRAYNKDNFFTVTSEDGNKSNLFVVQSETLEAPASTVISDFRFRISNPENSELTSDVVATIGGTVIYVALPYQALQEASLFLEPDISIPDGASISPSGAQNFKDQVSYTVNGSDGQSSVYSVSVSIDPNSM